MYVEESTYWYALSMALRHKGGLARHLLNYYGSVPAVFQQTADQLLSHKGLSAADVSLLKNPTLIEDAAKEAEWIKSKKVTVLRIHDPEFPSRLRECPDAPLLLYCVGKIDWNSGPFLSVVGTRSATEQGKACCYSLIRSLADMHIRPTIVSGLAYGIDTCAHRTALECGLPTVAVIPSGVDCIYPAGNRDLAKTILKNGAVVSEFPSKTSSHRYNFLQRNRIIAGLSDATLVVESKQNGGSLITAHFAMDYDREVMAVPGRPSDPCSAGCNRIIHACKASLVASAQDIADVMGWESADPEAGTLQKDLFSQLEDEEKRVLLSIQEGNCTLNALHEHLLVPVDQLAVLLTRLEMYGILHCSPTHQYTLIQ